jgi:hypothetical protein
MSLFKTSHPTPWALIKFGSEGTKFAFIRSAIRDADGAITGYKAASFKWSVSKIVKSGNVGELYSTTKKIEPTDVIKQWRNLPSTSGLKSARGRYLRELNIG